MKNQRIYDSELTLKIVNEKMNYDFDKNNLISGEGITNTWRKNGYLAYDMNGEKLGIIFEDDKEKNIYYKCANILFFKPYRVKHNLGIWRIIKPIDYSNYTNANGYIDFLTLEQILSEKGSFVVTTKPTYHH
ncbi:hypothetical protein [Pumilibacter muris]|uniref:hypothetical protein n=1 Tax=Pumilibacter muris TaxID=2941510 RepID=UPI00203DBB0F|nr:hypothetical protein [Pumilibacter muris]